MTVPIEPALAALGDLLAARGGELGIVVVGGAALNVLGFVSRTTRDVDVIAIAKNGPAGTLEPADPLPEVLRNAAATVARDLNLAPDWLNAVVSSQWQTGLPPGLPGRVHWRRYGALHVGLVDRYDLIFFKLYAAADDVGPESRHFQDLLALRPTREELTAAAAWVRGQDPSPDFSHVLDQVLAYADDRPR